MTERAFKPGFRLSAIDVLILVVGAAASAYVMSFDVWLGVAIAFVVLHFFLFCNIVRMSRPLELLWAAGFIAAATAVMTFSPSAWPIALAVSLVVTIVAVVVEARRPSYHGVGWQRVNPGLPEWWKSQPAR